MRTIDVEGLLQEVAPEAPSGESLEYDPLFLDLEQAAQGRPEQQMGDQTVEAEAPSWEEVKKKGLELAARTKDLRVGTYLAQALARTDGLPGLRDALALLRGYVAQYWENVHPQLDEDGDPTMRVNILVALGEPDEMLLAGHRSPVLEAVREATLVRSPQAGTFCFKDVLVARGELPAPPGSDPPTEALINGVFSEQDAADLRRTADTCAEAREAVIALEADLTERVGSAQVADLSALPNQLGRLHAFLTEQLARRGVDVESVGDAAPGDAAKVAATSGEISSRDDVVRTLERISRYYETREPSSPIPLLMERAKRLVHANFVELVKDLAPEGLSQVQNIRGRRSDSDDDD